MEEKKHIKISLKTIIVMICIILIITITSIYFLSNKVNEIDEAEHSIYDTVSVKTYENKDYYIIEKDYEGDYDLQFLSLSQYFNSTPDIKESFEVKEVMSYEKYKAYCNKWGIKEKYSDSTKNYIVFSNLAYGFLNLDARLAAAEYNDNKANIYIWDNASGVTADISAYVLAIPTDKNIDSINIIPVYTNLEYENIQKYNTTYNPSDVSID